MRTPTILKMAVAFASLLGSAGVGTAAQHCVNPGGTGGCFATIQAAVDGAAAGDTIEIRPGVYPGHVVVDGKSGLALSGAGAEETILEPGSMEVYNSPGVKISGMTVRGSSVNGIRGSGNRAVIEGVVVSGHTEDGVEWYGGLVIRESTIRLNQVDGIDSFGRLQLLRSTVADNSESGVESNGTLLIDSSTISGNAHSPTASFFEAGVATDPGKGVKARISRSTIAGNRRGVRLGSRTTLGSTIVADNVLYDCGGFDVRSRGYNLIENPDASCLTKLASTDLINVDPALDVLAGNGGPTETHALLVGSPAIGVVRGSCRHEDQRGIPRSVPCDIGAYEAP